MSGGRGGLVLAVFALSVIAEEAGLAREQLAWTREDSRKRTAGGREGGQEAG